MHPWFNNLKPITWQGWLVYLAAMTVAVYQLVAISRVSTSLADIIFGFFPQAAVIFLMTALVIRAKRGHHRDQ